MRVIIFYFDFVDVPPIENVFVVVGKVVVSNTVVIQCVFVAYVFFYPELRSPLVAGRHMILYS
jgi:hypothetical protein